MIDPLSYFWVLLKASLFSTGGTGNLPSLHEDLLERGWATERNFAESLAVGQVSPGPSGLWVISLGYLTAGALGALLALAAITLPPLLVLLVERLHRRFGEHAAARGFVHGLSLAVVGVSLVVLVELLREGGTDARALLILGGTVLLAATGRVPVAGMLALSAVVGVLLYG